MLQASVDVNGWVARRPGVEEVRPRRCPWCGEAGRPSGGRLGMVGHGVRSRQVRGPSEPGAEAQLRVVEVRRYRCRRCGHAVTVVPRGVATRRQYGAWAIALGCWLWSFGGATLREVRRRVAPGRTEEEGWAGMRRWLRAVEAGRLFRCVRPWPEGFPPRRQAERVAATVMSLAPGVYTSVEAQLHEGAAHAA